MNSINALTTRIDILNLALQEMARTLSPDQAAQVADGFLARAKALADMPMTEEVDEAASVELMRVLNALGQDLAKAS